jgi:lycopene cyclase domain-containing protein
MNGYQQEIRDSSHILTLTTHKSHSQFPVNIYADWLPERYYYLFHLLAWMLPIVAVQWAIAWKILARHLKLLFWVPFSIGTYLILTDMVAVHFGVWYFDKNLILGFSPGGVPIEEWIFFYLTALLVAQSFIMFLPDQFRR